MSYGRFCSWGLVLCISLKSYEFLSRRKKLDFFLFFVEKFDFEEKKSRDFGEILAESTQTDPSLHRSTLFVAGVPGNAISGAVACLACEFEHFWRVLTTFPLQYPCSILALPDDLNPGSCWYCQILGNPSKIHRFSGFFLLFGAHLPRARAAQWELGDTTRRSWTWDTIKSK